MSLLAFWEEGNSVQTEAVDFGRSYYLLLAIFGAEVAAGCFWRADLSLADAGAEAKSASRSGTETCRG